ncbi:3',5'-cyclic-nucleotide phosphodiesterase PDE1 [Aspergillus lucknowensis]|uniref:cAMP phosphodiesterases class-II-domain-containing protein n=1 Tax=Aspergillus lucknowensis TaxID=176173 RepID=A0ABR4LGM7_9EURO
MLIVCLEGSTGGPREDRVTSILIRSQRSGWARDSIVAVDAGTLLSPIIDILDECEYTGDSILSGPFMGLRIPHKTPKANAAFIFQKLVKSVVITHPHLDHVSALAINSPALEAGCGPKTVAALPSVVEAMKNHVFNDVIFPNLSDEDGGAGLITYQRLAEGGNPMIGRGDDRCYVRVSDGLVARCFGVSHGKCKLKRGSEGYIDFDRRLGSVVLPGERQRASTSSSGLMAETTRVTPSEPFPGQETTVESSAFFIREQDTGMEVLVFGDVEPDSLSLHPRNRRVWEAAAPKVASQNLRAIFIECSYSDNREDEYLFGHMCPRHLIAELSVLAQLVADAKHPKRKRVRSRASPSSEPQSPRSKRSANSVHGRNSLSPARAREESRETSESIPIVSLINQTQGRGTSHAQNHPTNAQGPSRIEMPLTGLQIYIIHVKDDMTDGPYPGEKILQELVHHNQVAGLGCTFQIPERGESIYL